MAEKEINLEDARKAGREMAKGVSKKLAPQIKAIADTINEHDQRLINETRSIVAREIIDWGNEPCPHGTLCADTSKASKRECDKCWSELESRYLDKE